VLRAVGHHEQLVLGVEGDEPAGAAVFAAVALPARDDEEPLDEALAQQRVVQAPLVLDRQQREALHERAREDAGAGVGGDAAAGRIDLDLPHPGAGRAALEDEAAQVLASSASSRRDAHARIPSVWSARCAPSRAAGLGGADQAQRLARDRQPVLDLRADRHPLDERAEVSRR